MVKGGGALDLGGEGLSVDTEAGDDVDVDAELAGAETNAKTGELSRVVNGDGPLELGREGTVDAEAGDDVDVDAELAGGFVEELAREGYR